MRKDDKDGEWIDGDMLIKEAEGLGILIVNEDGRTGVMHHMDVSRNIFGTTLKLTLKGITEDRQYKFLIKKLTGDMMTWEMKDGRWKSIEYEDMPKIAQVHLSNWLDEAYPDNNETNLPIN